MLATLKELPCIYTDLDKMMKPSDVYFAEVTISVPHVALDSLDSTAVSKVFLRKLGVKDRPQMEEILKQNWSNEQLIEYLETAPKIDVTQFADLAFIPTR